MLAVLFYMPKGGLGLGWWLMAFMVIAAGLGPFGSWVRSSKVRSTAAKFVVALLLAGLIATTTFAAYVNENCDPWLLQYFWICWPI